MSQWWTLVALSRERLLHWACAPSLPASASGHQTHRLIGGLDSLVSVAWPDLRAPVVHGGLMARCRVPNWPRHGRSQTCGLSDEEVDYSYNICSSSLYIFIPT